MKARIVVLLLVVQSILFFGHWLVYETWTVFRGVDDPPGLGGLQIALILLSISFICASLLAFRSFNPAVRLFYRFAAIWLGFMNFFFMAAWLCWIAYFAARLAGLRPSRPVIAETLFGLAILLTVFGMFNAAWIRVKKITVKLPGLPETWRGRTAALVTDTHLGHVNGRRFMRRIVAMVQRLRPDAIFLAGDLYDGSKVDADALAAPWKAISAPLGAYFVTGNHEEFSNSTQFADAVQRAGIRVLNNEMTTTDGLQIVGVRYGDSTRPDRFRAILEDAGLDRERASILLSHAPHALEIGERAGISLQLSGHTHGGQIFPFTWITRRVFRQYTYGLQHFGKLLVYTSYGAGTWGPPLRVGSHPEIVLIKFE